MGQLNINPAAWAALNARLAQQTAPLPVPPPIMAEWEDRSDPFASMRAAQPPPFVMEWDAAAATTAALNQYAAPIGPQLGGLEQYQSPYPGNIGALLGDASGATQAIGQSRVDTAMEHLNRITHQGPGVDALDLDIQRQVQAEPAQRAAQEYADVMTAMRTDATNAAMVRGGFGYYGPNGELIEGPEPVVDLHQQLMDSRAANEPQVHPLFGAGPSPITDVLISPGDLQRTARTAEGERELRRRALHENDEFIAINEANRAALAGEGLGATAFTVGREGLDSDKPTALSLAIGDDEVNQKKWEAGEKRRKDREERGRINVTARAQGLSPEYLAASERATLGETLSLQDRLVLGLNTDYAPEAIEARENMGRMTAATNVLTALASGGVPITQQVITDVQAGFAAPGDAPPAEPAGEPSPVDTLTGLGRTPEEQAALQAFVDKGDRNGANEYLRTQVGISDATERQRIVDDVFGSPTSQDPSIWASLGLGGAFQGIFGSGAAAGSPTP